MDIFDEGTADGRKAVKSAVFYNWVVTLGLFSLVLFGVLSIPTILSMVWTIKATFAPSAGSDVSLYPSLSCPSGGNLLIVGVNSSCLSSGSAPDNDTLYDSSTFIYSASDPTRALAFLVQGTSSTETTLQTSQTVNRTFILPDFDGTALVQQTGTGFVFVGQTAQDHASNAGIQQSSLVANRAQLRVNQYGANTAGAGITAFKSRSTTIGASQALLTGDIIYSVTAIGVAGDSVTIPLAATIRITASNVASNYVGTSYELALVDNEGRVNGRRAVFGVNSHGWPRFMTSTSTNPQPAPKTPPSDVVTLSAGGTLVVANHNIPANANILLTVQPGFAPLGTIYISAITASTSFTISSTNAGDAGVVVYYLIIVPL